MKTTTTTTSRGSFFFGLLICSAVLLFISVLPNIPGFWDTMTRETDSTSLGFFNFFREYFNIVIACSIIGIMLSLYYLNFIYKKESI